MVQKVDMSLCRDCHSHEQSNSAVDIIYKKSIYIIFHICLCGIKFAFYVLITSFISLIGVEKSNNYID